MSNREIVSNQFHHNNGIARVESDAAGHLSVTCSGCGTDEFAGGMAPALGKLVADHPGPQLGQR